MPIVPLPPALVAPKIEGDRLAGGSAVGIGVSAPVAPVAGPVVTIWGPKAPGLAVSVGGTWTAGPVAAVGLGRTVGVDIISLSL